MTGYQYDLHIICRRDEDQEEPAEIVSLRNFLVSEYRMRIYGPDDYPVGSNRFAAVTDAYDISK